MATRREGFGSAIRAAACLARAVAAGAALAAAGAAAAQEVSDRPHLRIEAGMHTTRIVRVDADASGRFLVTASEDRTARVWDVATGQLVQTLRVPIGGDNDGWVYAAAIAPDGKTVVLGGWMSYGATARDELARAPGATPDEPADYLTHSLFVYDLASGRMVRRIPGLGNVANDLAFSPDGRLLAVAVGGGARSLVLDVATWTVTAELGLNDGASYNLAWAPDGRLASVTYDGVIRLFGSDFRQLRARRPFAGQRPFDLEFSPDGALLAVGYESTVQPLVLDGKTLATVTEPDITDVAEGSDLGKVEWSADGSRLIAGGSASFAAEDWWPRYIRIWQDKGAGPYQDLGVAGNTILDLETLPDGSLAVVSGQPDIIFLNPGMKIAWQQDSPNLDYSAVDRTHFRMSADGRAIGATPYGGTPFVFDVPARALKAEASQDPAFLERARGLAVTDWLNTEAPKVNGRTLDFLEDFEWSRSVAVAHDGTFAAIGGDWNLYLVNPDGSLRWQARTPGAAWTINVSGDGRLVGAAYADGTIRWYDAEDGSELLALYVHADGQRWVLWTPSGYYDAAPGGEDLIGWHVNRGLETEPVFFSASLFRDRFYRPDVVQAILETRDEAAAVALADAHRAETPAPGAVPEGTPLLQDSLPPVVRIDSPARGAEAPGDTLTVELGITAAADAPLTEVRVFINGRPQRDPPLTLSGGKATVTLDIAGLTEEELWVTVMGANRHGFGPPADVMLRRPPEGFRPVEVKPRLYVLAIGTSVYRDEKLRLQFAAKDAGDFADLLRGQAGALYSSVEVRLITDAEATYDNIRDGLFWLEEQVTANDTAYLFVAGHGVNDNRGELYFLPFEGEVDNLRRTAVASSEFVRTIEYLPGRTVYFMDSCHSGNLEFTRRSAVPLDVNGHLQDLYAATGAVVFSSATGSQYALESAEWGNGAFTLALREGLDGRGDVNGDGAVSVNELNLYVSDRVKELTANRQTPVLRKRDEVADFPLAVLLN